MASGNMPHAPLSHVSAKPSVSLVSPAPRPPVTISPGTIIHDKAFLTGTHPIKLGADSIIHPFARLDSTHGPLEVGSGTVIWERASLGTLSGHAENGVTTVIGANAILHPSCVVHAGAKVGEYSTIGNSAVVGPGVAVGMHVTVSPFVVLEAGEDVRDYETVFKIASRNSRRVGILGGSVGPADALLSVTGAIEGEGRGGGGGDVSRKMKDLKERGHAREVGILRRVVKSGTKWTA